MITIGFSTHRLEVLSEAERLMKAHETVALEEPPNQAFSAMLDGTVAVESYLEEADYEFLEFARKACDIYRALVREGVRFVQVDPYLEILGKLHEFFAEGGEAHELPPSSLKAQVYRAERAATAALIHFYRTSVGHPFEVVVDAVKKFAHADASRIRLRDDLRAEALTRLAQETSSLYVESGYIHWRLYTLLKKRFTASRRVRPVFLLERPCRRLTGRKQVLGPGDVLTLRYVFHPGRGSRNEDLLAARSLITIKLLRKEEMVGAEGRSFPHLEDEWKVARVVNRLSLRDCRRLWSELRRASRESAWEVVRGMLGERFTGKPREPFEKTLT